MQNTAIKGVSMWSAPMARYAAPANSYFIAHDDGNIAVDPLPLSLEDAAEIEARGGLAWVVVTNQEDRRDAAATAERFGAKVAVGGAGATTLRVDRRLGYGDSIGPAEAIVIDGVRTDEIALALPRLRTVITGPVLRGIPAGSLQLAPDDELRDAATAVLSLRALRALRPRHVLVTTGAPIFRSGYEALNECLDARTDAPVNVVNFDELVYVPETIEYPRYDITSAEVGHLLGATLLGYQTVRIPSGQSICPLHWHSGDEELFVIWEGTPTLLSPRGETALRRGDIVCFVTGAAGAHKIVNRAAGISTILMIANDAPVDACFYPDSRKVLVSPAGVMVRSEPQLKYFDFEPVPE